MMELFGFAVNDVSAHDRIVLAQFKSIGVVATILFGQIHVRALGAAHLDQDSRSLFSHNALLSQENLVYIQSMVISSVPQNFDDLRCSENEEWFPAVHRRQSLGSCAVFAVPLSRLPTAWDNLNIGFQHFAIQLHFRGNRPLVYNFPSLLQSCYRVKSGPKLRSSVTSKFHNLTRTRTEHSHAHFL